MWYDGLYKLKGASPMTPYDARLSALHEKLLRKRQLCAERNELNAQLSQLQETERRLRSIRTAEQEDVDKLQRVSLSSLFYSIVSQKEEKLAKEQAEAYAAAVKHDAAIQQCRTVEQRLLSVETELQTLSTTEREYEETLAQKAEALKTADPARGAALCRMEDRLSALAAQAKELTEAERAGQEVLQKLYAVSSTLDSAEGWGTWDLFGGGLITDLAKYSKLDEAQSRINELQSDLNRYRAELADVMLQANIQVDIGDFLRFADYFFDDVFSSWAVLDCIRNTAQQAASARQKVLQIQDRLSAARAQLEQETAALDQQHRTLVLEG